MTDAGAQRLARAGLSVLVTGASGFLGTHVLAALNRAGVRVTGIAHTRGPADLIDAPSPSCLKVDLFDVDALRGVLQSTAPDCVLHLAADALRREIPDTIDPRDNAEMTQGLLAALEAEAPGAAFVLASSESVYGPSFGRPFEETDEPAPAGPYAQSKLRCEMLARRHWSDAGRRATSVRFSNLYGGGDRHLSRLVPGAIRAVLAGEAPQLRCNPGVSCDFLHVDDAVRGLLSIAAALCLDSSFETTVNIASGKPVTIIALARRIAAVAGKPGIEPVAHEPMDPLPPRQIAITRAHRLLQWTPQVDLDAGLKRTVDWYRAMAGSIGEP